MGQWNDVNVYDSTWLDLTGFNLDNNTRIVDMCLYLVLWGFIPGQNVYRS